MSRDFLDIPTSDALGVSHQFADIEIEPNPVSEVVLRDVTLREGDQASDIALSISDKVEIATLLDDAGIPLVQVGFAGVHDDAVARIAATGPRALLSVIWLVFRDGWEDHGRSVVAAGAGEVIVTQRISADHLHHLSMSEDDVLRRLDDAAKLAHSLGARRVALQPAYMMGARPEFLKRLLVASRDMGFESVDVIDSTGSASPEILRGLVGLVKEHAQVTVGTHFHNDLGLATANNLAAIRAGAGMADVSVLGVGERAGNASMQQLVAALAHLYGISTGVNPRALGPLCDRVAEICGEPIHRREPVVGRDVFSQKVEFHITSFLRDFTLHEPFSPDLVGRRRELRLGAGSGPVAVAAKARELDLELDDGRRDRLADLVNDWAFLLGRAIRDDEFAELVRREG